MMLKRTVSLCAALGIAVALVLFPTTTQAETAAGNDEIAGALVLRTLPFSVGHDVAGATASLSDPQDCWQRNDPSAWYAITAPYEGVIRLDSLAQVEWDHPTKMSVFTGPPNSLQLTSCGATIPEDTDGHNEDFPFKLRSEVSVVEGQTLYVMVEFPTLLTTSEDHAPGEPLWHRLTGRYLTPSPPTGVSASPTSPDSATLNWLPPTTDGGAPITGYRVARDGGSNGGAAWSTTVAPATRSLTFSRLTGGSTYRLSVSAITAQGVGPAASVMVPMPAATAPSTPTDVFGSVLSGTSATLRWSSPASDGGSTITGFKVVRNGGTSGGSVWSTTVSASTRSLTFNNLTRGSTYLLSVSAINAKGTGAASSVQATPATKPGAPIIGTATSGTAGGSINATATWKPPSSNGGSAVEGYWVRALRLSSTGRILGTTVSTLQPAAVRGLSMTLPQAGKYRFTVEAVNVIGTGPGSKRSNLVTGR